MVLSVLLPKDFKTLELSFWVRARVLFVCWFSDVLRHRRSMVNDWVVAGCGHIDCLVITFFQHRSGWFGEKASTVKTKNTTIVHYSYSNFYDCFQVESPGLRGKVQKKSPTAHYIIFHLQWTTPIHIQISWKHALPSNKSTFFLVKDQPTKILPQKRNPKKHAVFRH